MRWNLFCNGTMSVYILWILGVLIISQTPTRPRNTLNLLWSLISSKFNPVLPQYLNHQNSEMMDYGHNITQNNSSLHVYVRTSIISDILIF